MKKQNDIQEYPDTVLSLQTFLVLILASGFCMFAAVIALPAWAPQLAASLTGAKPQAYWFLSRGSAFVAYSLIWLSMVLGILISNKLARVWPGVAGSFAIHEFASLLGIGFAMFHVLVLLGDRYINYRLAQLVIPFASTYEPFWVGVGQVGFFILFIVTVSFYMRKWIGQKTWRLIHYLSYLTYLMVLVHGVAAGTDTPQAWVQQYYWITGGILLFLMVYRVLDGLSGQSVNRTAHASEFLES